ncbi:MAG: calcium/sodium antiporter [Verrucomicrobia bacterium]|nr:calcium/sodium antiporter [Verrucomicrobiota bacterium]MDA1085600.1 calcium/sodium antiporter [Verrucomicrobiota bacterium]
MHALQEIIQGSLPAAVVVLVISFAVLAKCANLFVDSSIELANKFKVPRLVIGLVLVSLATTSPELAVSLMSALKGLPEMALGNAIGSVICDDGLALALCGIFAPAAIAINPRLLKSTGAVLAFVCALSFLFIIFDRPPTLSRIEGSVLIAVFVAYTVYLYRQHKKGVIVEDNALVDVSHNVRSLWVDVALFVVGIGGILITSEFIITSAECIAIKFGVPETVVALVLVAFGTSMPEIATCVVAARKNEGALAVGNILGADIMNICWVAGASAIANDLTVARADALFMFPWMFVIVATMLILLRIGYSFNRPKGIIMLVLYLVYLASFFIALR